MLAIFAGEYWRGVSIIVVIIIIVAVVVSVVAIVAVVAMAIAVVCVLSFVVAVVVWLCFPFLHRCWEATEFYLMVDLEGDHHLGVFWGDIAWF